MYTVLGRWYCIYSIYVDIRKSKDGKYDDKLVPVDLCRGILQILGQKNVNPAIASLILSLESCFSVLSGWVILGERLSARETIGCIMMFAAIILAQIPDKKSSADTN